MNPLASFSENPIRVHFETQAQKEQVILFLRQHPIVNLSWLAIAVVMILAPTFFFPLFFGLVKLPFVVPTGYLVVGTLFWYLATTGFILANFLGWYFNIYIVTDQRVVDIDFKYLLYKHLSQAELSKIQDLSYISGGIVATMFNYGTVLIETAGEIPNIEFDKVPNPEKVVTAIRNLTSKFRKPHGHI